MVWLERKREMRNGKGNGFRERWSKDGLRLIKCFYHEDKIEGPLEAWASNLKDNKVGILVYYLKQRIVKEEEWFDHIENTQINISQFTSLSNDVVKIIGIYLFNM